MKILFLTPRNSKNSIGGVERHVRLLTEELEKRGHEVEELSLDDANKRALLDPSTRRRLLTRDDILFKLRAWRYLWQKRDVFKWADIIHIHDVFWWYAPFAAIAKITNMNALQSGVLLRRKKHEKGIFTTFHGWEGKYPPSWSAIIQKRIAKKLSRGTIGVGRFFMKWYGVSPDQISWGALEDKWTNRPIDKLTNGQMKKFRITFYGRLETVNGIEVAIRAFEILKDSASLRRGRVLKDVEFFFIGDGPARKEAENIGTVTGMVNNPRTFLLQSDLVITSSYLCMLEAAALKRPIISIATNPLKNDYLTTHPLAGYITLVRSSKELVDRISSFDVYTQREVLRRAKNWSLAQTPKKLADIYINLWRTDVSIPIN